MSHDIICSIFIFTECSMRFMLFTIMVCRQLLATILHYMMLRNSDVWAHLAHVADRFFRYPVFLARFESHFSGLHSSHSPNRMDAVQTFLPNVVISNVCINTWSWRRMVSLKNLLAKYDFSGHV